MSRHRKLDGIAVCSARASFVLRRARDSRFSFFPDLAAVRGGYGIFPNQWVSSAQTAFARTLPYFFTGQVDAPDDAARAVVSCTRNILTADPTVSPPPTSWTTTMRSNTRRRGAVACSTKLLPSTMVEVAYMGSWTVGADNATIRNVPERWNGSSALNRPRGRLRYITDGCVVRAERPRTHIRDLDHRRRQKLVLQATAPRLRVFDRIVVVHDVGGGDARRIGRQDVAGLKRRHALRRRDVNLSCEAVREVARERRLHAVRPLIQEDSVTAPDHCAVVDRTRARIPCAAQDEACSGRAGRDPIQLPMT